MRHIRWAILIFVGICPLTARAQQANTEKPLNDVQKLGQRVFQQRCAICHAPARPGFQMYGPALHKGLVVYAGEDVIKGMIWNGSGKMPGFKLGLQRSEIDAIVEYLKTVPKPPMNTEPATGGAMGPLD
jgi:mono/diheme cytochrome c family protein